MWASTLKSPVTILWISDPLADGGATHLSLSSEVTQLDTNSTPVSYHHSVVLVLWADRGYSSLVWLTLAWKHSHCFIILPSFSTVHFFLSSIESFPSSSTHFYFSSFRQRFSPPCVSRSLLRLFTVDPCSLHPPGSWLGWKQVPPGGGVCPPLLNDPVRSKLCQHSTAQSPDHQSIAAEFLQVCLKRP